MGHHRRAHRAGELAAEFAQRFALDHQGMDDAFWERLRAAFSDDEVADLIICCGMFLGLGPCPGRGRGARARGAHPRLTAIGGTMAAWLEHDLIIRGGTVIDGTGSPARTADVAISGGTITDVGRVDGTAHARARRRRPHRHPGLVDIHVHYDGQATWDDRLIPSSWHGVTTVVAGNCGVGFAPVRPADHDRLIQLMEGVEDIPGAALHEGLPWTWQSFPEFLDALDGRPYDVDLATHVPHGPCGSTSWVSAGAARDRHARRHRGHGRGWHARRSRPARSASAPRARATTAAPTASSRPSSRPRRTSCSASREPSARPAPACCSSCPTSTTSTPSSLCSGRWPRRRGARCRSRWPVSTRRKYPRQLELLEEANAAGVPMRGQAAARAIGILVGLQCTVNVLAGNPVWQEIAALSGRGAGARHARAELQGAVPRRRQAARWRRPHVRAGRPARLRTRPVDEHRGPRRP